MRSMTPVRFGTLLTAAVWLSACVSVPPDKPDEALTKAQYAITQAEQAVGQQQSVALYEAKQRLEKARALVADPKAPEKNYLEARRLAEEATMDARLAQARAEMLEAEAQKADLQESFETLREEIQRGGGRTMTRRIGIYLLLSTFLLVACTSAPMQQSLDALDQAQQAVATAAADPQVQAYTAVELRRAQENLSAAKAAWTNDQDRARAEHLAYMAQRHAEIAQAEAASRAAAEQSRQIMKQRDELRLQTRSQQVETQQRQIEVLREQLSELKPKQTEQGIMLTLSQVLFAFDSAQLQSGAQAPLDKLASFLSERPQIQVQIVGYTDSVGSETYNQRLSERRAQSVADAMAQRGIDRARMRVAGEGESNPVATNETEQGRQLNRRVEFTLLNQ